MQLAVTIIAVGAMAAGWETFTTDMLGYGLTMLNNLITGEAGERTHDCSGGRARRYRVL